MLHKLETLVGSHVMATDGKIGKIRTFLLDDRSWMVRYIVVEVSYWSQRDVLLAVSSGRRSAVSAPLSSPLSAIDQPDWATRTLRVHMTRRQVDESPDIETRMPVSLQQRLAMEEEYGMLAAWIDQDLLMSSRPAGIERPVHGNEDPHLRSTQEMQGYLVAGDGGKMGSLRGFVLDESSWHVGFLRVKSGLLHRRKVLIPSRQVQGVSWAWRRIDVHANCELHHTSEEHSRSTSSRSAERQMSVHAPEQLA
jgi:uncharacterized protein YrrD